MILLFLELIYIIVCLCFCVVLFKLFFIKDYKNYPPYVPTFGKAKKIIFENVSLYLKNKKNLTVADPGCGTAVLISRLAKDFPEHSFVGIEWNWLLYHIAKLRCRRLKNVQILYQDFFDYSFKNTDVIICFLLEPLMEKFGTKLKNEAKKGSLIYSNIFRIPNIKDEGEIKSGKFFSFEKVYVYKI